MPPILVPVSAKRIHCVKSVRIRSFSGPYFPAFGHFLCSDCNTNFRNCKIKMEEKILFWEIVFMMWPVPAKNYLIKVSNWSKRIRFKNCSRLWTKALERRQYRRSSVFVNYCEHISNFVQNINFERVNICWVYIWKDKHFWTQDRIYLVAVSCCKLLLSC